MMAQAAATETAVVEMTAEAAKAEAETATAAAVMTAETAEVTAPATAQQYNQRLSADKRHAG